MNKNRQKSRNNRKNYQKTKPSFSQGNKEYQHQNQLCELDVGITQFVSKLEGYSGVIKARFSDFQVNEIDLNGQIAKLTNQEVPKEFNEKNEDVKEPPTETPLPHIPQDKWIDLVKISQTPNNETVELNVTNLTKDERTQLHQNVRHYFGRKIVANTESKNDTKIMVFKKFDGKNETRSWWPKDKGEYVHFVVYKECLDTLDATLKISNCLRIPASCFNYAGVKDKRAKTTQWFSAKKVQPWKLIFKTKKLHNIHIGNITLKDKPLKLGDLKGNKFRIALRNVVGSDELIEQSLLSLKEKGFINYYGLQRFGNDKEVPTFSIGVQLLLGNWKKACQIILKPTQSDRPELDITKAKKLYAETGNAAKALEHFDENKKTCIEFLLLSGIAKENSNDFVNALSSIPRNTRLLYLHSFQSLVWNFVASKRIEKFGFEVVEGDLVVEETEAVVTEESEKNDDAADSNKIKVKALSSSECSNYTIYDIVLPLPGYDIVYPTHLEDFYKETLESYGLTLEMIKQKVREYSLSGTYRKLMGQVQNFSWRIMRYNDPNYNLIRSDFEEMRGFEEPKDIEGGTYKALVLEFCLEPSSYATMVLREILKSGTSSSAHAKLNNYHVETPNEQVLNKDENMDEPLEDKGLLSDPAQYEAFKNFVFSEEPAPKRKYDDPIESENIKVLKVDNSQT